MRLPSTQVSRGWTWSLVATVLAAFACEKPSGHYWIVEAECSPCALSVLALAQAVRGASDCSADAGTTEQIEDCAIASARAGRPFIAIERLHGIDSTIAIAYLGGDGGVRQLWYDSDVTGGMGKCSAVIRQTSCQQLGPGGRPQLCLGPGPSRTVCDESPSRILASRQGGLSTDLFCVQEPGNEHRDEFICARQKASLEKALATIGSDAAITRTTVDLICKPLAGVLDCTRSLRWRRRLGFFQEDRVEGPLR